MFKFFVGVPTHLQRYHDLLDRPEGVEDLVRAEAAEHGDMELLDIGEGRLYMSTKRLTMLQWVSNPAYSVS
jgi:hypothetical protein